MNHELIIHTKKLKKKKSLYKLSTTVINLASIFQNTLSIRDRIIYR